MDPFEFFHRLNHKVNKQYARQFSLGLSLRSIAFRFLFFAILLIIIFGVLEHNRLSAPCAEGRWRVVDSELVCVYSFDADETQSDGG